MTDVFVSYAREDEPRAQRVTEALRARGYRAWRDDELPAHRAYADVIAERLQSADAVVVLWSAEAARSQWVRSEADSARHLGKLVQATIDGSLPPMPFDQIQCADLSRWNGGEAPGWSKLSASVEALAGVPQAMNTGRVQSAKVSVCVLPFANMSGDAEQEYFSDGISEDITTDLSKVSALEVIARNTAFQFKGHAVDACDISAKLGVSHLLEGSVRKAGGRVRITAQLIDGRTGGHVWADRYDRDLTDIFAIQDEISKAIVAALKIKLLPEEKKAIEQRGTSNVEAHDLYLMARQYWISGNWGDTRQLELVSRICRRAVEVDPNYARAWGLLAIVQCILHFTFMASDDDGGAAADRALSLEPKIAEGHIVHARHLYEQGRIADCDKAIAEALKADPESWEVNREAGRIYYFQRRFDEAIRHYERAVATVDTDYHTWGLLSSSYAALGDQNRAKHAAEMSVTHAQQVLANDPTNGAALGMVGYGFAVRGEIARFKEWIDRAVLICPDNLFMRFNFACVVALDLKDAEAAIDILEPIVPDFSLSAFKEILADPDLDSLRNHPRFIRLMNDTAKRLGVAAPTPVAAAEAPLRS